jgi:cytochrome b561
MVETGGYPGALKFLHWTIAACVLTTAPVAIFMVNGDAGAWGDTLYNLHKSLGVLIFVLMLARIVVRITAGAPPPEPTIEPWQRTASNAVHHSLYALLVAMPIVGYFANSAYGATTPFFGLFQIPPIIGKNEPLSDTLFAIHRWTGWVVVALAAVHIGAALQHYFLRRDGVLQRMLPRALGGYGSR